LISAESHSIDPEELSAPINSLSIFKMQSDPAIRRVTVPTLRSSLDGFFRYSGRSFPYSILSIQYQDLVEMTGLEPVASALQRRRSPN
jgi:hypothetical protein